MHEEFDYSNAYKLTHSQTGPHKILNQLSIVNFELNLTHILEELLKLSILLN